MATYQSFGTTLDTSIGLQGRVKYDLGGNDDKRIPEILSGEALYNLDDGGKKLGDIPTNILCSNPVQNDRSRLLPKKSDIESDEVEISHPQTQRPLISGSIILATLFFGFSIGFSTGYFASEMNFFRQTRNNSELEGGGYSQHDTSTKITNAKGFDGTESKVLNFIEEFAFQETEAEKDSLVGELKAPLMRFPWQGPSNTRKPLIYLNRPEAYALLMESSPALSTISQYSSDFFLISSGMDNQLNTQYCGPATIVAILNSLRFLKIANGNGVHIPMDPNYGYQYATQEDIFDECTKKNVISTVGGVPGTDGILTPPYGMTMGQVSSLLDCHLNSGWKISTQYVDETHMTVGKMRFDLKSALADLNSRVVVNFLRSSVGQVGGGHWSPVGSYSDKEDAFLVLDVAKFKYPPVWIPSDRLFDAMSTTDDCGTWNFPDGQDALSKEERLASTPNKDTSTMSKLDCKSQLRGYIIITKS
uniref:glutathione gamma-glutamylcysteinyltransferase n=1 Tax=Chaetoceros debilis TaxID=122233 RepID=A0A7S3VGT7_9STRA|mmetsp:Transcript_18728/g.28448  ORF Transcript_18728/g.28448 Transcript_18728/m.28448 type:complete len:475 (+) Transcript_18728:180-1604(+)